MREDIIITGARQNNLKNINVRIPRNSLTVITGLSGSGKSSLAFDTLYAEGQRRYIESLSAYARQFLGQMQKPDVEHIEGLSPAISIEQRASGSNPRSIVATVTEIHDYLRLLYGNIGHAHCPKCDAPVHQQSAEQIVDTILKEPIDTKIILLAPVVRGRKGRHEDVFANLQRQGFVRIRIDKEMHTLDALPELDKKCPHSIDVVIDRLVIKSEIRTRLTDSVESALKFGNGLIEVQFITDGKTRLHMYSEKNACLHCGISFETLQPRSFSFNSPYGACSHCSGLGALLIFDEEYVVPNKTLPYNEAIVGWRRGGHHLLMYYNQVLKAFAGAYNFSLDTPYCDLPEHTRHDLMYGTGDRPVTMKFFASGQDYTKPFEGVLPNLLRRYNETEADETRTALEPFMSRQICPECHGARLRPESRACQVGGMRFEALMQMPVRDTIAFFKFLSLPSYEAKVAADILKEIIRRITFLNDVGLDYLSLDRESSTLSGGEMQRIRLASQIGSGLVGVLYVLDEPTIGLHPRDNTKLINMLRQLQHRGNTVVVVEHDEEMIRSADYVIDIGPGAGRLGGEVIYQGPASGLVTASNSLTADYLTWRKCVPVPTHRVKPSKAWLRITGATENNLNNVSAAFPIGCFTCVTGVSGSGKSTLVDDILYRYLAKHFYRANTKPGAFKKITGLEHIDKMIEIDQSPIGRTPRSNPVTYTNCFSAIRELFARTTASRIRGYKPGRFSFNVKGGRCEVCKGDGVKKLEMHFLPDVYVPCEQCSGLRYNRETLEIHYARKNIAEVLDMTVNEALEFFAAVPMIVNKLQALSDVGLGYIRLGQSSTTLSGGEAQRMKLATELSKRSTGRTLYLLDEPTTGLHFADVHKLLLILLRLRDAGNTVIVIEHNLDIIKSADYLIDMGPEGGDRGGSIIAKGTPEVVAKTKGSYTGEALQPLLARPNCDPTL